MIVSYALFLVTFALVAIIAWMMPDLVPATLPFGVRVPPERVDDPRIARLRRQYRATTVVSLGAIGVGALALTRLTGSPLAQDAAWALVVGVLLAAYYRAHRALAAIKAREGWYAGQRQSVAADTALSPAALRPPMAWLLPALAVIAATAAIGVARYPELPARIAVHFDASGTPDRWVAKSPLSAFSLVTLQVVLTALIAGLVWLASRGRPELDPALPETSAARARAFIRTIGRGLYLLAALTNLSLLFGSLLIWDLLSGSSERAMLLVVAPVVVGVVWLTALAIRIGQGGGRLPIGRAEAPTGFVPRDDDGCWIGGFIYYNPDDPALMVPKRFGVGWTLNFARPAAWIFLAAVLLLCALPGLLTLFGS